MSGASGPTTRSGENYPVSNYKDPVLPACDCGVHAWEGRGGSYSILLGQWNYVCLTCKRRAFELRAHGGNLFLIAPLLNNDDALDTYLNRVVMPCWTERGKAIDAARAILADQTRPAILAALGLPADTQPDTIPDNLRDAWRVAWEAFDARPDVRRPAGLERVPDPPSWPAGVTGYVRRNDGWEAIRAG